MRAGLIVASLLVLIGCVGTNAIPVSDDAITKEPAGETPVDSAGAEGDGEDQEVELPETPFVTDIFLKSGGVILDVTISSVDEGKGVVLYRIPGGGMGQLDIKDIARIEVDDD